MHDNITWKLLFLSVVVWNTTRSTFGKHIIICFILISEHQCSDGDLRLVGSPVDSEGTVEMCQNGAWNSLCSNNWGYQETVIVCRQLQLPIDGKNDHFYPHTTARMFYHLLPYASHTYMFITVADPFSNSVVYKCQLWWRTWNSHTDQLELLRQWIFSNWVLTWEWWRMLSLWGCWS